MRFHKRRSLCWFRSVVSEPRTVAAICMSLSIVLLVNWSGFCAAQSTDGSGNRGPGMKPLATDLKLLVPRTFDLTHVESVHFANALDQDPEKIFEFVRDQVAYEAYTGSLRGPRGTLLAMAGNSVDRAALLASLLENAGQRIRFARGTLPKTEARELVLSMWNERPRLAPADGEGEPSPVLAATIDTLKSGVNRDFELIRDHFKKMDKPLVPEQPLSLDALVIEAQPHYWVQWSKDDVWVDLDPSFSDSTIGRRYAQTEETLEALPGSLYHRVLIRIQLEEYAILSSGDAETKPIEREILRYEVNSADLAGVDVVLTHQPENWKEPTTDVKSALSEVIESTGRVKPVLIVSSEKWHLGEPFRQTLPSKKGLGGVGNLLGGGGTRKPEAIATAETLEIDLLYPDGRKETVKREIFDLAGKARRLDGKTLRSEEVRQKISEKDAPDRSNGIYSIYFTTGAVQAAHLMNLAEEPAPAKDEPVDLLGQFRRILVFFAATSDGLLERVGQKDRSLVRFYLDSPRIHILDLIPKENKAGLSIDLRRDEVRSVSHNLAPQDVFVARVLRGIVEGTLERLLFDCVTTKSQETDKLDPVFSTSTFFDHVQSEQIPTLLLSSENSLSGVQFPKDPEARLREDLRRGYFALTAQQPITFGDEKRCGWWRINPRTGDTVAVTDNGLFQTGTQIHVVRVHGTTQVNLVRLLYSGGELLSAGYVGTGLYVGGSVLATRVTTLMLQGSQFFYQNQRFNPMNGWPW